MAQFIILSIFITCAWIRLSFTIEENKTIAGLWTRCRLNAGCGGNLICGFLHTDLNVATGSCIPSIQPGDPCIGNEQCVKLYGTYSTCEVTSCSCESYGTHKGRPIQQAEDCIMNCARHLSTSCYSISSWNACWGNSDCIPIIIADSTHRTTRYSDVVVCGHKTLVNDTPKCHCWPWETETSGRCVKSFLTMAANWTADTQMEEILTSSCPSCDSGTFSCTLIVVISSTFCLLLILSVIVIVMLYLRRKFAHPYRTELMDMEDHKIKEQHSFEI